MSAARRLLVLCYFYPPLAGGGVHRVLGFTRHLPAHGWSCTVVCAGEEDYWVKDDSIAVPAGVELLRVRGGSALAAWIAWSRRAGAAAPAGRRRGASFAWLRRLSDWWLLPDSYAPWAARARGVAASRIARGGIDAVLSTSPPDSVHLAAEPLRRRFGLPWIADFRDPWIGLHFRTPPTAWHRERQEALERRVVTGADLVLAASKTDADRLAQGPSPPRRVEHLPNGYEPGPEAAPEPAAGDDAFRIVFTGTLSQIPDTEVLLEAVHEVLARRSEARRRLRVTLAGPFDTGYEDRAIALGLRGIVTFTGPLAHAETRALQRRADLLVLLKPRGPEYRTMVPGKLYEYLDAGRPLVALVDADEEAGALAARGGAELLPPGRREPLAEAIERRYAAWREGAQTPTARAAWLDGHRRDALAGRLARTLDGLVAGARA